MDRATGGGLRRAGAFAALCAGTAQAAAPAEFYGVTPQRPLGSADVDRMGQAQVGTLRFEVSWALIDPTSAAGDYNWAATDALVADARATASRCCRSSTAPRPGSRRSSIATTAPAPSAIRSRPARQLRSGPGRRSCGTSCCATGRTGSSGRSTRPCRGTRSGPGSSGTSRTPPASTSRSRSRRPTRSSWTPGAAGSAQPTAARRSCSGECSERRSAGASPGSRHGGSSRASTT